MNIRTVFSEPSENFAPLNLLLNCHGRGLCFEPPPSHSSSLSFSVINLQQQQPPPLLPLPIPKPYSYVPSQNRGLSCPPTNRRINRTKDQDITSKRPRTSTIRRRQDLKQDSRSIRATAKTHLGDLLVEDSRVLKHAALSDIAATTAVEDAEKFSGSVIHMSPPPSSLPLPKFSLRRKLSCNVEAGGGIDAGATDNLRRLLRLR